MLTVCRQISQFSIGTISNLITKIVNVRYLTSRSTHKLNMGTQKVRENPVVIKLDSPEFKSIFTPELNTLSSLFTKYNYELRIAGGAVRDLLVNEIPKDIDFATTATPEQMKEMFTKEEIRMINAKGEKHGTITARINDKANFEVTTLRIDVVTDGRHAEVQFTTDWMLDANRRDLTINSMFLGLDGSVYDYFFGYDDLQNRKIVFVGDADVRIKEDYLRILRYFRFYGRVADNPDNHDETTLRTISQNVSGLEKISGERIWSELKRILEGRFAGELMKTILHVGAAKYCGFPDASKNIDEFSKVWKQSAHLKLQSMTLLAALLGDCEDVCRLNERLKLSAYDRELAFFIVNHRAEKPDVKPLLPYQRLFLFAKQKCGDMKEWIIELLKYQNSPLLESFINWTPPKFPIAGNELNTKCGLRPGKFMGAIIMELKKYWVEHDFTPDADELFTLVPEIKSRLEENGWIF